MPRRSAAAAAPEEPPAQFVALAGERLPSPSPLPDSRAGVLAWVEGEVLQCFRPSRSRVGFMAVFV